MNQKNKGGAKPGHQAYQRQLIPEQDVDSVQHLTCSSCPTCQTSTIKEVDKRSLFQFLDLNESRIWTTNFWRQHYRCPCCRKTFCSPLPKGIGKSPFGPRLQALVSVLTGRYHLSKKDVSSLIYDIYHLKISNGVVSKIEAKTAVSLQPVHEEIKKEIQNNEETKHVDETPWRHAGKNAYVWQLSTKSLTLCEIYFRRNKEARDQLLGKDFRKPFVSDRYVVYRDINSPHQYCLAHILRNFQGFAEMKSNIGIVGKKLCEQLAAVFRQWRLYQKKMITWKQLKQRCSYRRQTLKDWLKSGFFSDNKKFRSFCKRLLEDYDCLWTFLRIPSMEPTNNLAERDLRPLVLWRKKSYGTKGESGLQFVSIMSSIVQMYLVIKTLQS